MSRFKFKGLNQKQGATVDAYISPHQRVWLQPKYAEYSVKGSIHFVHKIQEHLLNNIKDEHNLNHCLQEACKIESCIAQRKLLGLKSVQYDAIGELEGLRRKNSNLKIKGLNLGHSWVLGTANIVVPITNIGSVLHLGKHVKVVARKITLQKSANLGKARLMAQGVLRHYLNTERSM